MTEGEYKARSRTDEQRATDLILGGLIALLIVAIIVVPEVRNSVLMLAQKFGEGASMVRG